MYIKFMFMRTGILHPILKLELKCNSSGTVPWFHCFNKALGIVLSNYMIR